MLKICVLDICPSSPSEDHKKTFSDKRVDFFYVTYKSEDKNAISFNKNKSWAYNRNYLYNYAKNNDDYDYYFFIDYDIILENKDKQISPLTHIINQLEKLTPAMYRPSGFIDDEKKPGGLTIGGFINHSVTILHKNVAKFLFNLPTKYGGFWDAASYLNTIVVPIYNEGIYVDYDIIAHNTESSGYAQNRVPFLGKMAMNRLYKKTKPYFNHDLIPDINHIDDFKSHYNKTIKQYNSKTDLFDLTTIDPYSFINMEKLKKEIL